MKKVMLFIIAMLVVLTPRILIADEAVVTAAPPLDLEFLNYVIPTLLAIPLVGKYLVPFLAILGTIASFLTVLVPFAYGLLKLPEIVARWAGAEAIADKIKIYGEKIIYAMKFLSMYNAKKPDDKK